MKKKLVSMMLATVLTVSALAGCGNSGSGTETSEGQTEEVNDSTESASQTGEIETINIVYPVFGAFDDNSLIEEAVNAIAEEKIGVRANLNAMDAGQFMSQQTMLLSGSEDIDLIVAPFTTDAMNSGVFEDMSELIEEYGQDIKEVLGDDIDVGRYQGCIYGLPNLHEYAQTPLIIYDGGLAEELGLEMESVKTLEDMDSILAQVKEAHPEMSTLLYTSNSGGPLSNSFGFWDSVGAKGVNLGVIMYDGDPDKIVNLYETEEYKKLVTTLHDFSNKGYLNKDASILTENYWDLVKVDMSFADVISQHELIGEEYASSTGKDLKIIPLGDAMKATSTVATFMWSVMSTSEKQEAAMKFLNLLYSDAEVEDIICNGIEGVHYQILEDGKYSYPDGMDLANSAYSPNISWVMPNGWLINEWDTGIDGYVEKMKAYNENAVVSPAYGFVFDSANVANEMTACTNVVQQYCSSVEENGEMDVEEALAELNNALKEAGIDTIIEEKQRQYDEFLANK